MGRSSEGKSESGATYDGCAADIVGSAEALASLGPGNSETCGVVGCNFNFQGGGSIRDAQTALGNCALLNAINN